MMYNSTFLNRLDIASFISSKTESSPSKHSIKTLCFPFHISECREYPILGKLSFITLSTTSLYPINLSHKVTKGYRAMVFLILFRYSFLLFIKSFQLRFSQSNRFRIRDYPTLKSSFYFIQFTCRFHISYSNKYNNLSKV